MGFEMKLTRLDLLRLMIHPWPAGGFTVSLPYGAYEQGEFCQGVYETSWFYWFPTARWAVRAVIQATRKEKR